MKKKSGKKGEIIYQKEGGHEECWWHEIQETGVPLEETDLKK